MAHQSRSRSRHQSRSRSRRRLHGGAGSRWVDPVAGSTLCKLTLQSRRSTGTARALPPSLYAKCVAPFLRFDAPLPNMLYVFGGSSKSCTALDTVEMFDSWHGRWVSCARMPTRRADGAAALLPDKRIIVVGGYNEFGPMGGALATCDLYDPFTRSWDSLGAAPMETKRWNHGCASLGGKVYVVGGISDWREDMTPQEASEVTLRRCEVYSPEENRWSPCAPLHIAREGLRVVALCERYLAAIGGTSYFVYGSEIEPTIELFDSLTGCWSLLDSCLHAGRTLAAVAPLDSQRLLVYGGATCTSLAKVPIAEIYSPGEGGFQASAAEGAAAVVLPGDTAVADEADEEDAAVANEAGEEDMAPYLTEWDCVGCQAAVLNLPAFGSDYPFATCPCVAVVGGEFEAKGISVEDIVTEGPFPNILVWDIKEGTWRNDPVMPPLPAARSSVALCVGVGFP